MSTMLYNPYTGLPRHPSDIRSDPQGLMMVDPDEPLRPAKKSEAAERIEHLERVLVQARDWVAERPEDRKISAGKLVADIDEALEKT